MTDSFYIYKLVDPREREITRYIGITRRSDLSKRLNEHVYTSNIYKRPVSMWIKSLMNVGIKPEIILVDTCGIKDWEDFEKFYINKYKTKYLMNIEPGGISTTIRKYNRKGTLKNTKGVIQMGLNGDIINTFKSCSEAGKNTGFNKHVIAATCRGKQLKAYGYKWKFAGSSIAKDIDNRKKKVILFDDNGNISKIFNSVNEIAISLGKHPSTIRRLILNGSTKIKYY